MILSAQFLLSTAQSAGLAGLIGRLVLHVGVPMEPFPSLHNSCPLQPQPPAHVVHFYERDFFPAQSIANFFCAGLETGEVSLIIATAEHTRAIKESLEYCGLDPDALERADLLLCLDAPSILAALGTTGALTGCGTDDPLDELLCRTTKLSTGGRARVFFEAVNLLAASGEHSACLQLESLCNRLLAAYSFRLYCAYSTVGFAEEGTAAIVAAVCRLHDEVIPLDSAPGPLGWLTPLLEQSRGLQEEIKKCQAGEGALRALELEYARLFGEHVAHLQQCLEDSLRLTSPSKRPASPDPNAGLDRMVERLLHEILVECEAVCAARESAPEGGPESQKYVGEILAYGRLTSALCGLQQRVRARLLH